eukprot:scaffold2616_cov124-Skeletonema_menzelii.AAC.4
MTIAFSKVAILLLGIGGGGTFTSTINVNAQQLPPIAPEISYLLATIPTLIPTISKYETPMASRFAAYYDATWWNCVAAFSADYHDAFTQVRPAVVSANLATHNTANRASCVVQATASLNALFFGGVSEYLAAMEIFPELSIQDEVPDDIRSCTTSSGPTSSATANSNADKEGSGAIPKRLRESTKAKADKDKERTVSGNTFTFNADNDCLGSIAAQSNYDSTMMGHVIAMQTYAYAVMDGYNMLGKEGGCTVNCRAYADTTGYTPKGAQGRWRPLMEENEKGFFYKQEFVAPHIGQRAKFRFLPESDRADRVVRKPNYSKNREQEIGEVINQMTQLDDFKKVEVEAFDDKLYTTTQIISSFVGKVLTEGYIDTELGQDGLILSFERLLHFNVGLTAAEMDSIITAWKEEKVVYDLVRPTSVIIKDREDEEITTWAKTKGVTTYQARYFEAYIRVMPHAEYTSGSSCLFEAVKDYFQDYLIGIGLDPSSFPIVFPTVNPGESKVEPGLTPQSPITLTYDNIADMAEAGSWSRFNGGMHFRDSVPAGQELCSGIGNIAASATFNLIVM